MSSALIYHKNRLERSMTPQNTDIKENNIAVLIDGDNAQPSLLPKMLAEVAKHGSITIRRIYGDWTLPDMKGWKDKLNNYAVQPIQQFRYTVGKNATDSTLIIDAMDIMHSKRVDGFCIVSSDSDYTRLATRIRESGTFVMGIGEKKTPKAFVNACDVFVYTENIAPKESKSRTKSQAKTGIKKKKEAPLTPDPLPLLMEAFEMVVQENGWTNLGPMGKALLQLDPGFDSRTYGHKQLSQLLRSYPKIFQFNRQEEHSSGVYVKLKEER
jgi:hypothetical protein